jgi:hypothetical protein
MTRVFKVDNNGVATIEYAPKGFIWCRGRWLLKTKR